MNHGLSDQIRALALQKYVHPAMNAGKTSFSVAVRDLMRDLQIQGFPQNHWPQVCTAIQSAKFLRSNGLEIEGVDGPPSKLSTTVVVRYRVAASASSAVKTESVLERSQPAPLEETPEQWVERVTSRIRGSMKDEIAAHGGAEGYMRWVRSDDEDEA